MKLVKVAAIAIGGLVIAVAILATYGVPARGLIESFSRDALAKNELELDIGGDARVAIWPSAGVTIEKLRLRDAAGSDDLVTVERVHAGLSLRDLLAGRVRITELTLSRPLLQSEPMLSRSRRIAARSDRGSPTRGVMVSIVLPGGDATMAIDSISATNGILLFRDGAETAEIRFESLNLATNPAAGGRTSLHIDGRFGATTVRLIAGIDNPAKLADGQVIPIDLTISAPTALGTPVSLTATVTKLGPLLKVDSLNGTIDQGRIRGSMSVSFAGAKPFIDATLESERIDFTNLVDTITNAGDAVRAPAARAGATAPRTAPSTVPGTPAGASAAGGTSANASARWSDVPLNLFGLRLVEGNVNLSAREVLVQKIRIAPATLEATLLQDTLAVKLSPSGVYAGQATGELTIDRTRENPSLALRLAFSGIDALPFLRDAIDFQYVAGRARGAVDLKATGATPLRIVSGLNGRAELVFEDGAVRGLNLPNMAHSLLQTILAGWQASAAEETRFSRFGATFVVENGIARTTDVTFNGPLVMMTAAGSADLRAQTLDFRADPRLTASPERPGAQTAPSGIGVPVVIQGPWSAPRIYADAPNILANPDSALRALRDALGGTGGTTGGTQTEAPLGKFIEGLSKGFDQSTGDPARDGGAIAEELLKALGGTRGVIAPQPEPTAPRQSPTPPQTATPRSAPAPVPNRDLDRGAREILRDLLGR